MAIDTIPNLIARANEIRNETTPNANSAIRVGQLFVDYVDTFNTLKISVGGIPQATELVLGGLKVATQTIAQTAGEALLADRNHTDSITARGFRWAFETMLGKEWTWLDRQVFNTAVRLAYANANEYLKLDANKDIVSVSAIDYNDLDNLPDLSLKADLVGGLVPASQLPSYVDDVLEFANLASFPVTGETGKIYVALDTNKTYRWSGSIYVEVSSLDEALLADLQNILATTANTYVSPRRFWTGIQHTVTLAWTWSLKQTFSSGINVVTSSAPTANGDFVFNTIAGAYQGMVGGIPYNFPTSLNGKVGRVLFVSKDGNDSSAIVGSQIFTYFTIQGAINASTSLDTIIVYAGTYTESILIDTKRLDIYCIGKVTITGDITYTNTTLSVATYVLDGKSTIINGSVIFNMNVNSVLKINVLQVNKAGGTAFVLGGINRGKFIVNDAIVTSNFLLNGQDTQGLYYNFCEFTNVTFTGVSLTDTSASVTTTGIYKECRLNVSSYLGMNRTDGASYDLDFISTHYIECIIRRTGASTVELFLFNFGGLGTTKIERCIVRGTFTRLQQGFGGAVNRSSGVYLYECNFREATFTSGALFNVTDTTAIAQWKVFIDKTVLKPSTIVYQAGSLTPTTVGYEYIDFVTY